MNPILMFCIAFGLSMDYEGLPPVPHQGGVRPHRDNDAAVALGLERTGRIITAAALLLAAVFLAFSTSEVTFIRGCSASASPWRW